ncbi:MAG: prepilin-type N-terminal cleavage/methylation domain-containing protein, partial [Clostridia bacterium]|nr:prepilin-type N-terminal cleavage/methylation domain-containing protein [Clostridia bacterium]
MRLFLVIKNRKGMTLIELIVVLVIIAIISAVAIPSFSGYIEKAKAHECEVNREILKDNLLTLATL